MPAKGGKGRKKGDDKARQRRDRWAAKAAGELNWTRTSVTVPVNQVPQIHAIADRLRKGLPPVDETAPPPDIDGAALDAVKQGLDAEAAQMLDRFASVLRRAITGRARQRVKERLDLLEDMVADVPDPEHEG